MKLGYPYKAATAEQGATVLPRPDFSGCSSFRRTGMGGEPANANATATFEEAVLSDNPGTGLPEPSAPHGWDNASIPKGNRLVLSPLAKTRESACPRGCPVCFLAKKYRLTPREVTLIALISSGQSSRAMSQILGTKVKTICEYCVRIHDKIGTRSRLAIGLWAIREGMVKNAIPPESGRRVQDALRAGWIEPNPRE
jgi:DNA-binding CsgD family transcriptional regulator